jgi:tetratricopeptide (TPR) repeat protein
MHALLDAGRHALLAAILAAVAIQTESAFAQSSARSEAANEIRIVELQGTVEILRQGATTWVETGKTNQLLYPFDRLRTRANSRVTLRWSAQSVVPLGALTEIEVLPHPPEDEPGLHLLGGIGSFFHRDKPGRIRIITHGAVAGVEGTEFVIQVDSSDQTTLWLIDGRVRFTATNQPGVVITNGQKVVATPGRPPVVTAGFIVNNILQWCFYYPAVLDLRDLPLAAAETQALDASLAAFRSGDLLQALAKYPDARQPASDAERVYYAALLLSVGQVEQSENTLAALSATNAAERVSRLATALRQLIAAVKLQATPLATQTNAAVGQLSSELLAASYYEQSLADRTIALTAALKRARQAATNSPDFSFAWARVAELEFSFGRTERALDALNKSLALAPRNAQAVALKGFLLAAKNKTSEAIETFDDAIAIDSALGNAWLGRGLCRIRRGDLAGGREDLLVAAATEPQRAILRSYLGKAYGETGDYPRAAKELQLAKDLDPNDPTAWLYSALLNEQHNRINEAIGDLEQSQELNENRSVYRSGLLLDQDRAVRSANLARIYGEAGLDDVALHEASRASAADYGNFSAHLFLANSYNGLISRSPFDLRFSPPALSEYLIASLLGPADGRILAQPVAQQEYTRLFERDTLGLSSSTEYLSRGAWNQYVSQYGTIGSSSYAVEGNYLTDPGQTPNGHLESWDISVKAKQMVTLHDGLFFQLVYGHTTSGDLEQRYDPGLAVRDFELREKQGPNVLGGLDHQWSQSQRTLLLVSHFSSSVELTNPHSPVLLETQTFGVSDGFSQQDLSQKYHNNLSVNSVELQHLMLTGPFQTIAGARFQFTSESLSSAQFFQAGNSPGYEIYWGNLGDLIANQSFEADAVRISPYLYEYWQVAPPLLLIGGLSYDYQSLPHNTRFAPLDTQDEIQRRLSPKAGLVWTPTARATIRGAYSRSLGGFNLDQDVRLEPTQLAGFPQVYRNLIPPSLVGVVSGDHLETGDISLEYRFASRTYVAAAAQLLHSTLDDHVGGFQRELLTSQGPALQYHRNLSFQERSLDFSAHQLVGDWFSLGARYRLSEARLTQSFPDVDPSLGNTSITYKGLLHTVKLEALMQHPSGLFAGAQAVWWSQALSADLAGLPGDSFWQENLVAGYRFPRRHAEITTGILNLGDANYRLHPINLYPDLPRSRTFFVRLQLNF